MDSWSDREMDGSRRIHGGFRGRMDDGCMGDGGIHREMNGWMVKGWIDSWTRWEGWIRHVEIQCHRVHNIASFLPVVERRTLG